MKNLKSIIMLLFVAAAGTTFAQTTTPGSPSSPTSPTTPGQSVPQTSPQTSPSTTETERKTDFNAPQSPARPAQTPSEDTLIKGQRSSGAVMEDSLMPSNTKKKDRMNRKRNKKGTAESGDTTSTNQSNSTTKP